MGLADGLAESQTLALTFDIQMERNSYSRAEVVAAREETPARGLLCNECGAMIPIFEDLSEADEQRVLYCIEHLGVMMGIAELQVATGCSFAWAKVWVYHRGKPMPPRETPPCPYCGKPLRTKLAKQCRFCGRDWHEE